MRHSWITLALMLAACGTEQTAEDTLEDLSRAAVEEAGEPRSRSGIVVADYGDSGLGEAVPSSALVLDPTSVEPAEPVEPVVEAPAEGETFRLRRGETLAHFARWSGLPVEAIAEASELDLDGSYPVGTEVRVPLGGERLDTTREARDQHHLRRLEGYLASRGGSVGTDFVRVRTGDTAWSLARDSQGIPVWVLESFNPSTDLDRLRPGQELMVPVLADVVVEAEE